VDKIIVLKHSETKWRIHSNDKTSEVILHFGSAQSNSVDLEGCESPIHGV